MSNYRRVTVINPIRVEGPVETKEPLEDQEQKRIDAITGTLFQTGVVVTLGAGTLFVQLNERCTQGIFAGIAVAALITTLLAFMVLSVDLYREDRAWVLRSRRRLFTATKFATLIMTLIGAWMLFSAYEVQFPCEIVRGN
ncbi:MAG: hypothetical protein ITG02_01475 [Patulibacter sp.]|nr:hypothetical protein [Patulibacter sp.]